MKGRGKGGKRVLCGGSTGESFLPVSLSLSVSLHHLITVKIKSSLILSEFLRAIEIFNSKVKDY